MIFIYYLIIGALFTLSVDLLADHFQTDAKFSNLERIVVILFWPIALVAFVKEFLKIKK